LNKKKESERSSSGQNFLQRKVHGRRRREIRSRSTSGCVEVFQLLMPNNRFLFMKGNFGITITMRAKVFRKKMKPPCSKLFITTTYLQSTSREGRETSRSTERINERQLEVKILTILREPTRGTSVYLCTERRNQSAPTKSTCRIYHPPSRHQ